jgi:hypothetical protein
MTLLALEAMISSGLVGAVVILYRTVLDAI